MKVKDVLHLKENVLIMESDDTKCIFDDKSSCVPKELSLKEIEHYYQFGNNHLRIVLKEEPTNETTKLPLYAILECPHCHATSDVQLDVGSNNLECLNCGEVVCVTILKKEELSKHE